MPSVLKSVAYSYVDGFDHPYALDAVVIEDGEVRLDIHKKFSTQEDFLQEVEEVVHNLRMGKETEEAVEEKDPSEEYWDGVINNEE